ncbi:hypothetical protein [Tenacibaculum sp. 190524A02b]
MEILRGIGQLIFRDGSTKGASHAKIILDSKTGMFKTAYPYF